MSHSHHLCVGFWKGSWKIWNNFFSIVTKIIIYRYFAADVPFNDFWPNNHPDYFEMRKFVNIYNITVSQCIDDRRSWTKFRMAALLRYFLNKGILVDMKSRDRGNIFSCNVSAFIFVYIRFFFVLRIWLPIFMQFTG